MNRYVKRSLLVIVGIFLISTAWGLESKDVYTASVGSNGIQKVDMIGGSYYFKPNDIIVKVNVPVEIMIKKEAGFVPHKYYNALSGSGH